LETEKALEPVIDVFVLHGEPHTVKHEACSLLGYSHRAVKFPGEIPIFALVMSQPTGIHFSKPSGESSKMVPTLTENWRLG
jgi:hypothetical protein